MVTNAIKVLWKLCTQTECEANIRDGVIAYKVNAEMQVMAYLHRVAQTDMEMQLPEWTMFPRELKSV